jgi:hypothetical protein
MRLRQPLAQTLGLGQWFSFSNQIYVVSAMAGLPTQRGGGHQLIMRDLLLLLLLLLLLQPNQLLLLLHVK